MAKHPPSRDRESVLRSRTYGGAFLIGVAVMAALDEIVFHQILAWHHFYDRATPDIALISDGVLHAAEVFALVAGFFVLLDARRRNTFRAGVAWAGFLVGLGLFQLWDGIVDHKVLRLHQIRYGVDIVPYDIIWNSIGILLLSAGCAMTFLVSRRGRARPTSAPS